MPKTLEFSLASLVAVIAGVFGFIFLFSDPTGSVSGRALWYVAHFFLPGLLIGVIFPRAWYLAGVVAWPSVLAAVGTLVFVAVRLAVQPAQEDYSYRWSSVTDWLLFTVAPIALALLGGWIGRIVRRIEPPWRVTEGQEGSIGIT
jgi:hypothetical protein